MNFHSDFLMSEKGEIYMDEVTHTILPNGGGLSGTALGAGFGGLIGSWLGNGFGGFGGGWNRGSAAVGYDTGAINAMPEWLTANVYAAPMLDSRISKLKALCKIKDQQETQTVSEMVNPVEEQPTPLIKMDFLNDRISKSETETVSSDNRRKCRSDNK